MDLSVAIKEMADALGDEMTADMVGERFTCSEADTIARVIALGGHPRLAVSWLIGHARGDVEYDTHYLDEAERPMNKSEIWDYVRALSE